MWQIWAHKLLPKALKSCPKSNKLPNLVTLHWSIPFPQPFMLLICNYGQSLIVNFNLDLENSWICATFGHKLWRKRLLGTNQGTLKYGIVLIVKLCLTKLLVHSKEWPNLWILGSWIRASNSVNPWAGRPPVQWGLLLLQQLCHRDQAASSIFIPGTYTN